MHKTLVFLVSASSWLPLMACAQGVHAVSILPPPWTCVQLNVAPGAMADHPTLTVPLYAEPSARSAVIGDASDTMVAPQWPQTPVHGFVQVVQRRDLLGWIDARYVRPWANPYAPQARCQPAIMSNGAIGTK